MAPKTKFNQCFYNKYNLLQCSLYPQPNQSSSPVCVEILVLKLCVSSVLVYSCVYLVCVGAREKGDIVCSSKVVSHLLHLPVALSFSPFGPSVLEPHLGKEHNYSFKVLVDWLKVKLKYIGPV